MSVFLDKLLLIVGKSKPVANDEPDVVLTTTVLQPLKPMVVPTGTHPTAKPAAKPSTTKHQADKPTLDRIAKAHPKVRDELLKMYYEILGALSGKAVCRFAYVTRTFKEQSAMYAQGRTAPGKIVTNAPAGLSIHNYSLAFDFVLLVDKDGNGTYESASWDTASDFDGDCTADWMEVVAIATKYGWEWGGNWSSFKDLPHFQKTFGHKPSDLLVKYKAGDVDSNGYVNV